MFRYRIELPMAFTNFDYCISKDEISEELGNMRIKPAKLKAIGESLSKNKLLAKRKAAKK